MKAICVTQDRQLEIRDVPAPEAPPPGHVVVAMDASAINHGDRTFLARPDAAGASVMRSRHGIWGASGAGTIVAAGANVPEGVESRKVAIYRSLSRSAETIGLWSEQALVPFASCALLPDGVAARDYSGSLVNAFTAYAFVEEAIAEGHKGIIATAGNSATGQALAVLARRRGLNVIALVRSAAARDVLRGLGGEHVVNVAEDGFEPGLGALAAELGTTAVFEGVGGDLVSRIAPVLPVNSVLSFYGFLSAATPVTISTFLFMAKNLVLRRFSNFESAIARDETKLLAAMADIGSVIADPAFRTRIGQQFSFEEIGAAIGYTEAAGRKALLVS